MRIKTIELVVLFTLAIVVIGDGIHLAGRYHAHLRAIEAGGYEILLGTILAVLTLLYLIREPGARWIHQEGGGLVAVAIGILAAYALLMPLLGYLLSTVLAALAYVRILGGYRWRSSLLFAVTLAVGSAWLWDRLVIILPRGILPWP